MKQAGIERSLLLWVLLIITLGFFLLYTHQAGLVVSPFLETQGGRIDISAHYLSTYPNSLYAVFYVVFFLSVHIYIRLKLPQADPFILPVIALLSGLGIIISLRLSPDLAIMRNIAINALLQRNPDAQTRNNILTLSQLGMKHFRLVGAGIVLMVVSFSFFNRRVQSWLSSKKYLWALLSTLLILFTVLFGSKINNKRLWLFGFQTVELVKFLMVLFMAGYIYERGKGISAYSSSFSGLWLSYSGPFIMTCALALSTIFIQGDLGPTFLLFMVFLIMFYYAGNSNIATFFFMFLIALCGYIAYKAGYPHIVRERFDMLLDPFGRSESMSRVLWSISSGGVFGTGIGLGQPHRIPEVQSDFTFAAVCEELGFMGGIALILAYVIFIHRCLVIAASTSNTYKKALVIGMASLVGIQAVLIVSGNLSFIPMTGVTLPFVSFGGSSLMLNFFMAGLILRISGDKS